MALHDLAGKKAPRSMLVNVPRLVSSYYTKEPARAVAFGTSGHRGSSVMGGFNEMHVCAIAQAICEYRASVGINGPLFMGFDTHALSEPAFRTAIEVFAANEIETVKGSIDKSKGIHGKIEDSLNLVRNFTIRSRLIGLHELNDVIIGKDKGTVILSKK